MNHAVQIREEKTMTIAKESKRILSITVTRDVDTDPDTSFMGEYSDTPEDYAIVATGEHSGEFVDQLGCECGHSVEQHVESDDYAIGEGGIKCTVEGCNCENLDRVEIERGREFRYFNSASIESDNSDTDNRLYAAQDYNRMRDLNNNQWGFIGISAKAEVQVAGDNVQHITSGGLWGIESDSEDSYFTEVESEQIDELKQQLHAIGFSKRAITAALRNVERKEFA